MAPGHVGTLETELEVQMKRRENCRWEDYVPRESESSKGGRQDTIGGKREGWERKVKTIRQWEDVKGKVQKAQKKKKREFGGSWKAAFLKVSLTHNFQGSSMAGFSLSIVRCISHNYWGSS